jgi:hypothetical protein
MAGLVESAVAEVLGELRTVSGSAYSTAEIGERVRERLYRSISTNFRGQTPNRRERQGQP